MKYKVIVTIGLAIPWLLSPFLSADDSPIKANNADSLVIIYNPHLSSPYCIGAVLSATSVITPKECASIAHDGKASDILVYSSLADATERTNATPLSEIPGNQGTLTGARILYLSSPLESKRNATVHHPIMGSTALLTYYFIAILDPEFFLHSRHARFQHDGVLSLPTDNAFPIIIADEELTVDGDYCQGAILFNQSDEIIGMAFDEELLYSSLGGGEEVRFERISSESDWTHTTPAERDEM